MTEIYGTVRLTGALGGDGLRDAALSRLEAVRSVDDALAAAPELPPGLRPGGAGTVALWEVLATVAARDLALARAIEPHLDALAILDQAGVDGDALASVVGPEAERTWGVFAAEGPGVRVDASEDADGTYRLDGTKPWCSLAGSLTSALVTAHLHDGERALFAIDLRHAGVRQGDETWAARGLTEIPSTSIHLDGVPAVPVGGPGWYLRRPGFAWGGAGVAACWYGGAVDLARTLAASVAKRPEAELLLMHLGDVAEHLAAARSALAAVAAEIADGRPTKLATARLRATVARTVERVLRASAHALGPAPLALDAEHVKRVADLELYVRQHHAERDLVSIGRQVLAQRESAQGDLW